MSEKSTALGAAEVVFYVVPMGELWLVRRRGSKADAYTLKEDAIASAGRMAAGRPGAVVRVLTRAGPPGLARAQLRPPPSPRMEIQRRGA